MVTVNSSLAATRKTRIHGLICCCLLSLYFFFINTATTEIYTLSLHDALPISGKDVNSHTVLDGIITTIMDCVTRSEERFSRNAETDLVCRLLLEKKK